MLKDFNAGIAFLGVGGISDKFGITDFNIDEVQIKKTNDKKFKRSNCAC